MVASMAEQDPQLQIAVDRLLEAYRPERIYLFGSAARGDGGPDSDYDLLLVVSDDAAPECRDSHLAYEVLWGTGTAVDVVVWTHSRFEGRRHVITSLPATVLREGKLLHAEQAVELSTKTIAMERHLQLVRELAVKPY